METKEVNLVDTDVLVIGAGAAGLRAALRAEELGVKVALVDKGAIGRSGATYFCRGMMAPVPEGHQDEWLKEYVEHSDYLTDQALSGIVIEEGEKRIRELMDWGVPFERDEQGNLRLSGARGSTMSRSIHFDGRQMMNKLRDLVKHKKINLFERVMATNLLTSDGDYPTRGEVVGAMGLQTQTGECLVYKAKAVVIATGPFGSKSKLATYMDGLTGEGQAMAFQAGAELNGMEFATHGTFNYVEDKFKFIGQSRYQGLGARFINRLGEPIMDKYNPVLKERSSFGLISQALLKEVFEGRGPIYLDMRHFTELQFSLLDRTYPENMKGFAQYGIDVRRRPVEIKPVFALASTGPGAGLAIGLDSQTCLSRLFAAGNATKIAQSNPQTFANVSGYRAGQNAAKIAMASGDVSIKVEQIERLRHELYRPLQNTGPGPDEIIYHINKTITPAGNFLFKNEKRIRQVLQEIKRIKEEEVYNVTCTQDPHELIKANETRSIVLLVEMVYLAALQRMESRGPHYREEYPFRDDRNWLKWIFIQNQEKGISIREVPVPFERYKIRPDKLEIIPHPIKVKLPEADADAVKIDSELCNGCRDCLSSCAVDVIRMNEDNKAYPAYADECYRCGLCEEDCPAGAIKVSMGGRVPPELLPC